MTSVSLTRPIQAHGGELTALELSEDVGLGKLKGVQAGEYR